VNEDPTIVAGKGLSVGEYVLDEKIGQGAFGEVWRAHHRAWTDQLAAVKIPTDPTYLRQLKSEGFSLHRLAHPNIVRVIGFDPAGAPPYLMTELVNGPSLSEVLTRGRLPVAKSKAILRQILAGLEYAHEHGVVHGDLKPGNVLVEQAAVSGQTVPDGAVKLTDFGVGLVAVTAALGPGSSSKLMRTDRGTGGVSTLAYLAPEQREGAAPDAKSDIFACGVMLFELLTGERPAGAEAPSEMNPEVGHELDDIFRRAYARRDRRYGTAREFIAALDGVVSKPAPPVQQQSASAAAPPVVDAIPLAPPPAARKPVEDDIIGLRPDDASEFSLPTPVAPAPPRPVEPPAKPAGKPQRSLVVMDELARHPVRSSAELKELFQRIQLSRELEAGEIANLRLRMDLWAESIGGIPGLAEKVEIVEALDCDYHRVVVRTQFESSGGATPEQDRIEQAVILANPQAAQDCGSVLVPEDFTMAVHLSTGVFPVAVLEMIPIPLIRSTLANLLSAAKTQAAGRRIERQELKLARATVLSLRYVFEGIEHGICFAGASLKVVAPTAPLTKMRDELLKRAALLLDTENIGAGINELRQMFLTPNAAQPRAERMLVALRAKLSAAYMALARDTAGGFGMFESLAHSGRAADLLPGSEAAAAHDRWVLKRSFWVNAGPGLGIGLVFLLIAAANHFSPGFILAAIGAAVAGIVIWRRMHTQMARTVLAFSHACVVPLAIAAVLATALKDYNSIISDISGVILVVLVIVSDSMFFRKYGQWLLRPPYRDSLSGAPMEVLNLIQTILDTDWEKLRPYYVEMDPLYKHAAAKIVEMPAQTDEAPADAKDEDPDDLPELEES
jgi:serine/threonine protein kinase